MRDTNLETEIAAWEFGQKARDEWIKNRQPDCQCRALLRSVLLAMS